MKGTKPEYAVRRGHILSPGRLGAPPGARRGRAACRRVHAAHYEQPQDEHEPYEPVLALEPELEAAGAKEGGAPLVEEVEKNGAKEEKSSSL